MREGVHKFELEAMNTTFAIRIRHPDLEGARRLAGNCFRQLEDLEAELSRYRPDSEVSRINQLKAGESMLLADATNRCLRIALEASLRTAGLFDATMGNQTQPQEINESSTDSPMGKLILAPDHPRVLCEAAGRQIDLGGIGKGFALDEMARTLMELGVESAMLSSGASTHQAFGPDPWPMVLQSGSHTRRIELLNQALSASGSGIQGGHVVHPDTGQAPVYAFERVWTVTATAALSDAYSTACLLMTEEEIQAFAASGEGEVMVLVAGLGDTGIQRIKPLL